MKKIRKVVVAGAGVMGHSIAVLHALGAAEVWLADQDGKMLDAAFPLMVDALTMLHKNGFCAEEPASVLARIHKSENIFTSLVRADLLAEVISENAVVKQDFFAGLLSPPAGEPAIGTETLVVSNTSSLNVFSLAPDALLPQLYVAHHFVPAHALPLVEVLPSPVADAAATRTLMAHYRALGAAPVLLKKYRDGFCINRIQLAIHKEMFAMMAEGVIDAVNLDLAVKASLGIRIPILGVVKRLDFANLELVLGNMRRLDTTVTPPQVLTELVAAGNLGISTGRGFYDYEGKSPAQICRERDMKMLRLRRLLTDMQELNPSTLGEDI